MPKPIRIYQCERCGWNTTRKSTYDNHMNRKTSCIKDKYVEEKNVTKKSDIKSAIIYSCKGCFKQLQTKKYLLKHQLICNGINALKCPKCDIMFNNRQNKYYHMKNIKCTTSNILQNSNSPIINIYMTDNSITNNNINNGTINNIKICNFQEEDFSYIYENDNNLEYLLSLVDGLDDGYVDKIVKAMYRHPDHPENQTLVYPNVRSNFFQIVEDGELKYKDLNYVSQVIFSNINRIINTSLLKIHSTYEFEIEKRNEVMEQLMKEQRVQFERTNHREYNKFIQIMENNTNKENSESYKRIYYNTKLIKNFETISNAHELFFDKVTDKQLTRNIQRRCLQENEKLLPMKLKMYRDYGRICRRTTTDSRGIREHRHISSYAEQLKTLKNTKTSIKCSTHMTNKEIKQLKTSNLLKH
jgi:uncharacterized C2H2 Zn-finger protein